MKLLFPFLFLFLLACNTKQKTISRSFYHWKTNFNLDSNQTNTLNKLRVEKLYVKYFDVKWVNGKAKPVADVNWQSESSQIIIPVIYVTTDVFSNLDSANVVILAENCAKKIKTLHQSEVFTEVQIDCDWMPSIKDKYFYFLNEIQTHFNDVVFSATVRLYQYKYPKIAGVPPVDKGLLMYYNMGELFSNKELNSILNNEVGKQYLGFNQYTLPIDVALPNFSWSLVFQENQFQHISKDFSAVDFKNENLFEYDKDNWWWVKQDTVINHTYYRLGDHIRYESCSQEQLLIAAELLVDELNQDITNVIFYDLNLNLDKDYEKINTTFSSFE